MQKLQNSIKHKVYITRMLNKDALDILKESCEITVWTGNKPVPREELLKNIPGKHALLCLLTDKIDSEVLDRATDLKVISTLSVGHDHLDVNEIKKRNIRIGYTPNVLTEATAELTLALLLATSRRLIEANNAARNGKWNIGCPFWMTGPSLANSVVGIVGFGRIGQHFSKLIKPFNVKKILYHSRSQKSNIQEDGAIWSSFEGLCAESDFVVVTCSLNNDTKSMFDRKAFARMKSSCIFINTSRGAVVDHDSLVEALKFRIIRAAGVDVTVQEPLPVDSPLFQLENCVVLPHIGSASIQARKMMAKITAINILAALNGQEMPAELKI